MGDPVVTDTREAPDDHTGDSIKHIADFARLSGHERDVDGVESLIGH